MLSFSNRDVALQTCYYDLYTFSLQIQMNVQAAPTTATLMPRVLILPVPLHVHAIRDIAVMVSVRVQV